MNEYQHKSIKVVLEIFLNACSSHNYLLFTQVPLFVLADVTEKPTVDLILWILYYVDSMPCAYKFNPKK